MHICAEEDTPRYSLHEGAGSRRGQNFVVGDGGVLKNLGEKVLNLASEEGMPMQVPFQIAKVTRPLMSAGLICDKGYVITMDKEKAIVRSATGVEVCRFVRKAGGLYVARMRLKAPFVGRG